MQVMTSDMDEYVQHMSGDPSLYINQRQKITEAFVDRWGIMKCVTSLST